MTVVAAARAVALACLLLASALICWIAANWESLGRTGRFPRRGSQVHRDVAGGADSADQVAGVPFGDEDDALRAARRSPAEELRSIANLSEMMTAHGVVVTELTKSGG